MLAAIRLPALVILFGTLPLTCFAQSRFDPTFRNDLHDALPEDAEIVRILKSQNDPHLVASGIQLIHGHFLDHADDSALVTAPEHYDRAGSDSPVAFVFSKDTHGWKFRRLAVPTNYCQVLISSGWRDILLCQRNDDGYQRDERLEVTTRLFTLDLAHDPPESEVLQITDTTGMGLGPVTFASIDSVEFREDLLHVSVAYGWHQTPRDYELVFQRGKGGFLPLEASRKDFDVVTGNPAGDSAEVTVTTVDRKRDPVTDVAIRVFTSGDTTPVATGKSGAGGVFRVSGLTPRASYICGSKQGFYPTCKSSFAITPGENRLTLYMLPAGSLGR